MSNHLDRYTCEETFRRLDDYLDRELSPEELRLVEEHLAVCAFCVLEFQFEAHVLEQVRAKLRAIPPPHDLLGRVLSAVNEAEGESDSGEPV
jgi:predicted anti-sigma-YlaC factor YlaD